ncbi:hypothetical protein [Tumebacillus flagellatus]|uniref:Uncharacterized protein n=1 Tax=Tumebacillus flagellatus TaxID=1157490 RepID=A0A074LLT6_9BACL|nr:hypothetical protein [Tumebacillus flagellatus]KEO80848.1 hypothetical protein EL26_24075 [Tumebacillus flagellatus]
MCAWSDALRASWEIEKGGAVIENKPTDRQIDYYRSLIAKSACEEVQYYLFKGSSEDDVYVGKATLAATFAALDLAEKVDKKQMSILITRAQSYRGFFDCASMDKSVDPEKAISAITDDIYDQYRKCAIERGYVSPALIWQFYNEQKQNIIGGDQHA